MKILTCLVSTVVAVTACGGPVPVPIVTELGTGGTRARGLATAISDNGRIVGAYDVPSFAAEFRDDGSVVFLRVPTDYQSCEANGIADDGTIAGNCALPDLNERIFTWDSARVAHPLRDLPAGAYNRVVDMNRHGVILEEESGGPDAGYWTHDLRSGKRTKVPFAGGVFGQASAINDTGDIVGFIGGTPKQKKALKWSGDPLVATVLAAPPGPPELDFNCYARATGINNRGAIVGYVCNTAASPLSPPLPERLVVWSSASAFPEDRPPPPILPGYVLSEMYDADINDDGILIGHGVQVEIQGRTGVGAVWTADRHVIDLGVTTPIAINAAGVIVGRGFVAGRFVPVRVDLVSDDGISDVSQKPLAQ